MSSSCLLLHLLCGCDFFWSFIQFVFRYYFIIVIISREACHHADDLRGQICLMMTVIILVKINKSILQIHIFPNMHRANYKDKNFRWKPEQVFL